MASLSLRVRFTTMYQSICERSLFYKVTPPDKESLWQFLNDHFSNNFTCGYCDRQLLVNECYPSKSVFSFDHDIPLATGGTNHLSNLVLCCHSCNVIKGTMTGATYRQLLKTISPELLDVMFEQSWQGKISAKIERDQMERII